MPLRPFLKYPHNSLLGVEIAKTLYYRRRFWEAIEILRDRSFHRSDPFDCQNPANGDFSQSGPRCPVLCRCRRIVYDRRNKRPFTSRSIAPVNQKIFIVNMRWITWPRPC